MSFADVVFLNYDGHSAQQLFKQLPFGLKQQVRLPCNRVYIIGKDGMGEKSTIELDNKNIIATAGGNTTYRGTNFFLTENGELFAKGQKIDRPHESYNGVVQLLPAYKIKQIAASNCAARAMVLTDNNKLLRIGKPWDSETFTTGDYSEITSTYFTTLDIKSIHVGGIGDNDVCMIILKNGDMYSMGQKTEWGELGREKTDKRFGIVAHNVEDVFVGGWHTHYLTRDGRVFAFGFNRDGRCGVEKTDRIIKPVELQDFRDKVSMISNGCFSALLTKDGRVYHAGSEVSSGYKLITNIKDIVKIGSGVNGTIALSREGKVYFSGTCYDQELLATASDFAMELKGFSTRRVVDVGAAGPNHFAVLVWE